MKQFLFNLGVLVYGIFSVGILLLAIVFPFALSFEEHPPYWLCWVIYPLSIIIMASQEQVIKYIEKIR